MIKDTPNLGITPPVFGGVYKRRDFLTAVGQRAAGVPASGLPDCAAFAQSGMAAIAGFAVAGVEQLPGLERSASAPKPTTNQTYAALPGLLFNRPIARSPNHSIFKFPVNSLFLCMPFRKTRNPCGFSRGRKKIPCFFPCYWEIASIRNTDSFHPKFLLGGHFQCCV